MPDPNESELVPERVTITRCRQLLGEEALQLSDEDVDAIGRHAHTMAHTLIEVFREPVYMRALKEEVLQLWKARKDAIAAELADAERRAHAIQKKLDRLDEAFLFEHQRQRFQQLFFQKESRSTAPRSLEPRQPPRFSYCGEVGTGTEDLVDQAGIEPATS